MPKDLRHRFPGVQPFKTADQDLFFGRDRDITDLLDLVQLEKLVVLFSRSGYGKSSLINAGLLPALADENATAIDHLIPLDIRLTYQENAAVGPTDHIRQRLEKDFAPQPESAFLDDITPRKTLWYHFKRRQHTGMNRYLLIFDQFEEFFYFPSEQQDQFRDELAELLYKAIPQDVRDRAEKCTPEQQSFLTDRCEIKVMFAIRADRLGALDSLKIRLPAILNKRYELKALDKRQARQAIVRPAGLPAADRFNSPAFTYDENALETILNELAGRRKISDSYSEKKTSIESFQLQIVCDYLETKVRQGIVKGRDADQNVHVMPGDLPDFLTVYEDYYRQKLAELPVGQRTAARLVVEDGLLFINERTGFARRRTRGTDELVQEYGEAGVTEDLLQSLERSYLLRREVNTLGEYSYEISHDTLIAPVRNARLQRESERQQIQRERERREAEDRASEAEARAQAEALRRREAERLRGVAEKARQRANRFALGVGVLAALALIAFVFAWFKSVEATQQTQVAETQRSLALIEQSKADSSARIAVEKTRIAEAARVAADQNLRRAQVEEARAKAALLEVEREKNATEQQRRRAEENFRLAQEKKKEAEANALEARLALSNMEKANDKVVDGLIAECERDIETLHYAALRAKLNNAVELGRRKTGVAHLLLELAFVHNESGRRIIAVEETTLAALLLAQTELLPAIAAAGTAELRNLQRQIAPDRFAELEARYFPDQSLASLSGGTFTLKKGPRVTLAAFRLSRTETTVWQYNLWLASMGKNLSEESSPLPLPGWGWNGDNPMVNVSWYDAVNYANWLSQHRGLTPAYTIDTIGGSDIRIRWIDGAVGYRLPTEAEWEYAATGGAGRDPFIYAGSNILDSVGWYNTNAGNRARPVARLRPNGAGLYDLSGNVWEWCWDWFADRYPDNALENPRGPEQGTRRVARSGSFQDEYFCRVGYRGYSFPSGRQDSYGFRLARPE